MGTVLRSSRSTSANGSDGTKQAFSTALRQLVRQQPLEKISVSHICEQARLSRKTFYEHFSDKMGLINWICYTEFFENHRKLMIDGGWKATQKLAYYFEKDRLLYGHALRDTAPYSFGGFFTTVLEVVITNTTQASMKGIVDDERVLQFMAETVADTIRRLLAEWLCSDDGRSMDELFLLLHKGAEVFAAVVCSVPLSGGGCGPCAKAVYPLHVDRANAQAELDRAFAAFRAMM